MAVDDEVRVEVVQERKQRHPTPANTQFGTRDSRQSRCPSVIPDFRITMRWAAGLIQQWGVLITDIELTGIDI